ncbi:T9SS type A sorting domain-containing protein [Luteibaculum oceani]|uniref:T9SS type A sorting domain-containing protein n=1 Tax=Luteibaculum oceani TaxID=1294296 RepID=A0A5C6VIY2_9FLAO|nr:T9SS type A sorting domain-containing protein [Luteibaculum oceani]TXC85433.1 T9SS type A sorting domain-containing protein [Luteibaculum oceani]
MKKLKLFLVGVFSILLGGVMMGQQCSTRTSLGTFFDGTTYQSGVINLDPRTTGDDSIWFVFSVAEAGYLTVSSCDEQAAPNDTRLFLFDGNTCTNLNLVSTSDNACGLAALVNDKRVLPTKDYYLLWDNKSSASGLSFQFNIEFASETTFNSGIPVNDNICDASDIDVNDTLTGQSNEFASVQGATEYALGNLLSSKFEVDFNLLNTVWYSFQAPPSGVVGIEILNSDFNTQMALFEGTCTNIPGLQLVEAAESGLSNDFTKNIFCLNPGATYYIMVDGFGTEDGDFDIAVRSADLKMPYVVLIEPDTNGFYVCPNSDDLGLGFDLLVAADSSDIAPGSGGSPYDLWLDEVLAEYVDELSWELGTESGTGVDGYVSGLMPGTHTVTFTDICGDEFSGEFTFTPQQADPVDIELTSLTNPECIGGSGEIEFEISGGYLFHMGGITWEDDSVLLFIKKVPLSSNQSDLDGETAQPVTGPANYFSTQLTEGRYRLFASDACEMMDSVDFVIEDPEQSPFSVSLVSSTDPYCPGSGTGVITVSSEGGEMAAHSFQYYIADTVTTDEPDTLVYSLVAGPDESEYEMATQGWYQVIGFDGCTQKDTIYIQLRDPHLDPLSVAAVGVNPTSFTAQDGSVTITASGGQEDFKVTWFVDGSYVEELDNMLSIPQAPQGVYEVFVSDSCLGFGSFDTTIILLAPLANDNPCDAIVVSEGDVLTTFHNNGATTDTDEDNLSIPVDQDEGFNGWEETGIQSSVWFRFTAPQSGAAEIIVEGLPYIGNLSFDAQVAVFQVDDCSDFNTYSYLAANDDNDNSFNNINDSRLEVYCLTPGSTYYILVDGFAGIGEQGAFSLFIEEIELDELEADISSSDQTCNDGGMIEISDIDGGVFMSIPENYTYSVNFNNGDSIISDLKPWSPSIIFDDLAPGVYNVKIMDTCGVGIDTNITINPYNPNALMVSVSSESPTCVGDVDGAITIEYSDGAGGYQTTFNQISGGVETGGPFAGDSIVVSPSSSGNNINAGVYLFTVTDACLNSKQFQVTVSDPVFDPIVAQIHSIEGPECPGSDDASFATNLAGGNGQYYVTLRETGGLEPVINGIQDSLVDAGNFVVEDLEAGEYFIVVQGFCLAPDTAFIDTIEILDPVFDPIELSVEFENPSSAGVNDGSLTAMVADGAAPYEIWFGEVAADSVTLIGSPIVTVGSQFTMNSLFAGLFKIGVNDNCGGSVGDFLDSAFVQLIYPPTNDDVCDAINVAVGSFYNGDNTAATVEVGELSSLVIPTNEDCESTEGWCLSDGINASVWHKFTVPSSGAVFINLYSDDFDAQLAVFEAVDCGDFDSFTLVAANDDISVSGGNTDSELRLGCLTPGEVLYVLVDANHMAGGTELEGLYSLTIAPETGGAMVVSGLETNPNTEISNDGSIDVSVSGGFAPYSYSWVDNGMASTVTSQDRFNLDEGEYNVTVTDDCGLTASKTFTLVRNRISYDDACSAFLLPVDNTNRVFSNEGATLQVGELAIQPQTNGGCYSDTAWCSGDGLDASIWFKFYAPASGKAIIDLCNNGNNGFDSQLAVYKATSCSNFATYQLIAANDDADGCALGSKLSLKDLDPCAVYMILIDPDDNGRGDVGIKISDPDRSIYAGKDVVRTACLEEKQINLTSLLAGNVTPGGSFAEITSSGHLSGSIFDITAAGVGTYKFEYTVSSDCFGEFAAKDKAVITVNVVKCTGIQDQNAELGFTLAPNPAEELVEVSIANSAGIKAIEITDYTGKKLMWLDKVFQNGTTQHIDISELPSGVYLIKLHGNLSGVQKLIKK